MRINKISHIGICVSDIDESLKVYRDLMGFRLLGKVIETVDEEEGRGLGFENMPDFAYKACILEIPSGEKIELIQFLNPKPTNTEVGGIISIGKMHVAYAVNDLEVWKNKAIKAGYHPVYKPLPFGVDTWLYFKDNDGMIFEFIQTADADPRVESIRFLHLGYTVTDMDKAIDFMKNTLGLKMIGGPPVPVTDAEEAKGLGYPELPDVTCSVAFFEVGPGQILELLKYDNPVIEDIKPLPINTVGKHHMAFDVDDINVAFNELKAKGCEAVYKPLADDSMYWAYLKDFDGTFFELGQSL